MKYHFKIHKERDGGYWAECVELEGCFSQGETRGELRENLFEALNLYLSEPESAKLVFPLPKKRKETSRLWSIAVEPRVAFALTMRNLRMKKRLTQTQMKVKLGMKHLSDYQRLEDPKRANPRLVTLKRVKTAFPSLKIDEILAA